MEEVSVKSELKLELSDVIEQSTENDKQTDGFFVTDEAQNINTNFVSPEVKIEDVEQNTNDSSNDNMFSEIIDVKEEDLEPDYDNCEENGLNVDTSVKESNVAEIQTLVIDKKVTISFEIIQDEPLELINFNKKIPITFKIIEEKPIELINLTLKKCTLCSKNCRSMEEMKEHFKNCHPNETFIACNLCNKICKSEEGLQQHFRKIHPNTMIPGGINSSIQCKNCGKFYKSQVSLKIHKRSAHKNCEANFNNVGDKPSKQVPCTMCSKIYKTVSGLKRHMKKLHPNSTNHVCDVCGTIFSDSKAFIKHKSECLKPIYECHVCHKKSLTVKHLKKHIQIHNKNKKLAFKCEICSKQFYSKDILRQHLKFSHTSATFDCHVCHKKLCSDYSLKKHLRTHDKDRKRAFACEICLKQFYCKDGLKSHLKNVHKIQPLICKICDQKFQSKELLDEHISLIHESAMNLEQHTATQSVIQQITKYKCNICGESFTRKKSLETHIINVHDILVEPEIKQQQETEYMQEQEPGLQCHLIEHNLDRNLELKCEICSKQFFLKKHFENHLKLHQNTIDSKNHDNKKTFECPVCNKVFSHHSKRHLIVHNSNRKRDYKCEISAKHFYSKNSLRCHLERHEAAIDPENKKPFECHVCKKKFIYADYLKQHVEKT